MDVAALSAALQNKLSLSAESAESDAHCEQHARLTLQSAQFEVVIDIVGADCVLVQPNAPHCRDLLGRPLSPGELLVQLQKKGIHLLPTDHDLAHAQGNCVKVSHSLPVMPVSLSLSIVCVCVCVSHHVTEAPG